MRIFYSGMENRYGVRVEEVIAQLRPDVMLTFHTIRDGKNKRFQNLIKRRLKRLKKRKERR